MISDKWKRRFIRRAMELASWSKDPSTQCGCVIYRNKRSLGEGYNGYPAGVADNQDSREVKLMKTIHAEINAILHAKQDVSGATLFVYPFEPCGNCASVIIQAGITHVIAAVHYKIPPDRWLSTMNTARDMFKEAGVTLEVIQV